MSTVVPELPAEQRETVGDDLAGMGSFFIDPEGAAKRVPHKWFWVGPLIILSIISIVAGLLRLPMTEHVLETMPMPANSTPEQFQRGVQLSLTIQHIVVWLVPLIVVIVDVVTAAILLAMSSILALNAKFRSLFNLVAGCSLIQGVAAIASVAILKAKGEVSTVAELQPPLGLDIFMPEGSNKYLTALLASFSIFEIWWLVMMVLVFSRAFRVSKAKAFIAVLPLVVLGVIFRLVGAAFTRT